MSHLWTPIADTPATKALEAMRAAYIAQCISPGSEPANKLFKIAAEAMTRAGFIAEYPCNGENTVSSPSTAEPVVRFPVTCPRCGTEQLTAFPVAEVESALLLGRRLPLYATCHEYYWSASELELEQIREYLGAAWATAQGECSTT
jgi:hypothetical protein